MTRSVKLRENGSRRVIKEISPESKVEQQHGEACNINTIMRKMHAQGIIPHFKTGGNFGDFTGYTDFHTAKNRIIEAKNDFMRLPSQLRSQFDNDPGKLLDFLADPENLAEAREMGLVAPEGYQDTPKEEKTTTGRTEASEENPSVSA